MPRKSQKHSVSAVVETPNVAVLDTIHSDSVPVVATKTRKPIPEITDEDRAAGELYDWVESSLACILASESISVPKGREYINTLSSLHPRWFKYNTSERLWIVRHILDRMVRKGKVTSRPAPTRGQLYSAS